LTNLNGDVYAQIKQHRNTLELEYVLKSAISYAGSQLSSSQISAENKALFARISQQANQVLKKLYQTILRPSAELRNDGIIYRIGTFLTFFISRNNARYYDDSLIFQLDRYFWTGNPDTTVKKMKDIGLSYLLADLNAATIDQDPRHNLTARFENLLRTFTSSGLELIQTDNICLQMALDEKDTDYMTMAGVNYESYEKDASGVEKTINRNEKTSYCMNKIYNTITSGKVVD
jgi:hypothetical protein